MTEIVNLEAIKNLKKLGNGIFSDGDRIFGVCSHCNCAFKIQKSKIQGKIATWACPVCVGIVNHSKLK